MGLLTLPFLYIGTTSAIFKGSGNRVSTVMEKSGKSWKNKFPEKLWKTCKKLKVMEKNQKLSKSFAKGLFESNSSILKTLTSYRICKVFGTS